MIELELVGVRVELPHNQPIVLLKERDGTRFLPIWIGPVEATSIAFALQGVVTPRPMTHDLMRDLLESLSVEVNRIVVTDLREGTFYAEIHMGQVGGGQAQGEQAEDGHAEGAVQVSSRPSDAIALAVRTSVPIYAEEGVLSEAGIEIEDDEEQEVERFKSFLDNVRPEDFAS